MDEPALLNASEFHASVLPILDRDGAHARLVIVKASFAIGRGGALRLAHEQRQPRLGDEMWGGPEIPDVRLPGDYCIAKVGTDFILSGHAVPLKSSVPVPFIDVGLRVADRSQRLRVHGLRHWRAALTGVIPGPSAAVEPTPISWSRAYGGFDASNATEPVEEPRNPVGSGVARDVRRLVGTRAPQIERPDAPVGAAGGRNVPAGCAAIGRSFEPRRSKAGTYDDAWLKGGYPARPADYDTAHENCAAPEWLFREPLRGGEGVNLTGVSDVGPLAFSLPKFRVLIEARIDGQLTERRPHLDTVVVDSDGQVLELVWRALFRCPARMRNRFTAVRVRAKEFLA
jgi:hypothetical protein